MFAQALSYWVATDANGTCQAIYVPGAAAGMTDVPGFFNFWPRRAVLDGASPPPSLPAPTPDPTPDPAPDPTPDPEPPDEFACRLPAFSVADITLDEQVGDWAGVEPLALDEQGDDSPQFTGDDLRAVYVAQSSEDLFVRVDLWENVNPNFGNGPIDEEDGRYGIVLNNVGPFAQMHVGIAFDIDRGEWSVGHNGASSGVPGGLEGPTFVAVSGSVIEFGVPLSLIGNPSGFTEVLAEALTTAAQELDQVGRACVSG